MKSVIKIGFWIQTFCVLTLIATAAPALAQETTNPTPAALKLYRLDCGNIHVSDLNVFSDTDAYIGQEKSLIDSCYLIQHNDEWLLWDAGLPGDIAEKPEGVSSPPFTLTVKETIPAQLEKLGLTPQDIDYVAVSHTHFDHIGNVNLFQNAQLLLQQAEYDFLTKSPEDAKATHMDPDTFEFFFKPENKDHLRLLNGDTDIFGDGTLKAIRLPGHTPGHMALLVNLPKSGPHILSGDQWHFDENHESNGVPSFNYNRADTISSSDKLDRLIKNHNAKLVIQHEPKDSGIIPPLPAYLE